MLSYLQSLKCIYVGSVLINIVQYLSKHPTTRTCSDVACMFCRWKRSHLLWSCSTVIDSIFGSVVATINQHVACQWATNLLQLQKGFRNTLQMELLICLHPDDVRSLLVPSTLFNVTLMFLLESFIVHYPEPGSNLHTLEEAVMLNWSEFITDCSGIYDVLCVAYVPDSN